MDKSNTIEDKDLLQKLQMGDRAAFQCLYSQYYGTLYLHAYNKLRDRETAKDIVQDLFTWIWQKKETLAIHGKLSSYLYTGVRNRILDHISKEQSRSHYLESLSVHMDSKHSGTDHLLREKMLQEQIEGVLTTLSPRVREIFELSRKHYLSHKEISERLNLTEQSVRSYIKDALRLLRMKLGAFPWVLLILYCKLF